MCGFWDGFLQARFHPIIIVAARFVPSYNVASCNCASSTVWDCRSSQCRSPAARSIPSWKVTVWGLSQLIASTVTSSVLCGLLYACVVRWSCCVMTCWLGGGESGENKTVPQHPPSRERAWTKGVGDCNE